jgi:hypothetical protein
MSRIIWIAHRITEKSLLSSKGTSDGETQDGCHERCVRTQGSLYLFFFYLLLLANAMWITHTTAGQRCEAMHLFDLTNNWLSDWGSLVLY